MNPSETHFTPSLYHWDNPVTRRSRKNIWEWWECASQIFLWGSTQEELWKFWSLDWEKSCEGVKSWGWKTAVANDTKQNIPEVPVPTLPRQLVLMGALCVLAVRAEGAEQIASPALHGDWVLCLLKDFRELVMHGGREVANLESKLNVLSPSHCYQCDKLSY